MLEPIGFLFVGMILLNGLLAGLLYGYSCSVNRGLAKLSDEMYLQAFQSINREIINPVFLLSFLGTSFLLPIICVLEYSSEITISFQFLFSAFVLHFVGVLGITGLGNIPLNNQLEKFPISSANKTEISEMRSLFEKPWNRFHTIRTIASIFSFFLSILALGFRT